MISFNENVIKRAIDRLNGTIQVSTEAGVGTMFRISLPLTMSITHAVLVRVGGVLLAGHEARLGQLGRQPGERHLLLWPKPRPVGEEDPGAHVLAARAAAGQALAEGAPAAAAGVRPRRREGAMRRTGVGA